MRKRNRLVTAVAAAAALAAIVPALGLAAMPIVNEHETFTDGPYPTNFCGVPGTQVDTVIDHYMEDASGGILDNEIFNGVFTATATGRSLQLSGSGVSRVNVTDNGDGSVTFAEHDTGLVLQFKIPNGPVLKDADGKPLLGAGILSSTATFDIASGDLLSIDESWHGPHPLRDGVDICGPTIAYLTG
jgi:hypothetical protein